MSILVYFYFVEYSQQRFSMHQSEITQIITKVCHGQKELLRRRGILSPARKKNKD